MTLTPRVPYLRLAVAHSPDQAPPVPKREVPSLSATVIIPARFGSTRFPAKILASSTGRPLVQHVVDRVRLCQRVSQILVATDDQRIVDALRPFNTTCVLTSPDHPSGTDRIAEVARNLEDSIVVNVQGDEPEIEPEVVDGLVGRMETSQDDMATAATPFLNNVDADNPNLVKVVLSLSGHALYFSRSRIPFVRDAGATGATPPEYLLHLGIYAYRREFLLKYAGWAPTPLELSEKLEQLRALEHGSKLYVMRVSRATHGIDTEEQYKDFVQRNQQRPPQGIQALHKG